MAAQPINPKTNQPYRPHHLPPPTELPLRHCSHNENSEPIDEVQCLLSLLSPGGGPKKNKEHYTLATADPPTAKKSDRNDSQQQRKRKRDDEREEERALRRARALRAGARSIPGVPVIYVKRSVMVLEPMSTPSEAIREGVESDKFRAGLDAEPTIADQQPEVEEKKKIPGLKKAKGPNPLSMKKAKKRTEEPKTLKASEGSHENADGVEPGSAKTKRRRRHHKGSHQDGGDGAEASEAIEVDA